MLTQKFVTINQSGTLWKKEERVLLAISGGVDSMVLLELFRTLPREIQPRFGVAHVNHQLRQESVEEARFLKAYCHSLKIPYYEHTWLRNDQQSNNLEEVARQQRYVFFAEVCKSEGYDCLVTAHHNDDQAETVLMKLTSGSQLRNLVGIRPKSQRLGMAIYRPLLDFSKVQLIDYATTHEVTYFEDQTNKTDKHYRNRIRNQVIPKLKSENKNFLKHIHSFVKQIRYANDIIETSVSQVYPDIVTKRAEDYWELDLVQLAKQKESLRYFVLVALFQQALVEASIEVNEAQVTSALQLLAGEKAQGELHLAEGWLLKKRYQQGMLVREHVGSGEGVNREYQLLPGNQVFLNDHEWLAFERLDQPITIPKEALDWQQFDFAFVEGQVSLPLIVRRPKKGDRFILNEQGNAKKVSRLFIDNKISVEKRLKTWLVSDLKQAVLWIIPIRKSYLSISEETDKIHYRLIYLKNEQDLEGDSYVGERH